MVLNTQKLGRYPEMKEDNRKKEKGNASEYDVFIEQPPPKVICVIQRLEPPVIDNQFQKNKIEADIKNRQSKDADK